MCARALWQGPQAGAPRGERHVRSYSYRPKRREAPAHASGRRRRQPGRGASAAAVPPVQAAGALAKPGVRGPKPRVILDEGIGGAAARSRAAQDRDASPLGRLASTVALSLSLFSPRLPPPSGPSQPSGGRTTFVLGEYSRGRSPQAARVEREASRSTSRQIGRGDDRQGWWHVSPASRIDCGIE